MERSGFMRQVALILTVTAVIGISLAACSTPTPTSPPPGASSTRPSVALSKEPQAPDEPAPAPLTWRDACLLTAEEAAALSPGIEISAVKAGEVVNDNGEPDTCAYLNPDGADEYVRLTLQLRDYGPQTYGFLSSGEFSWSAPDPSTGFDLACTAATKKDSRAICDDGIALGAVSNSQAVVVFLDDRYFAVGELLNGYEFFTGHSYNVDTATVLNDLAVLMARSWGQRN